MPDDRDDLDAVLRRAMASLDGEVPAGYFDALPARVLARLDDPAIGEATGAGPAMQAAPAAASAADSLASARGPGSRGRRAVWIAIGVAIAASAVIYLGARDRGADSSAPIATRSEGARATS
ncbi:MAG TPA: hypothetical protein VK601_15710, partial [Kofleriaceae bacterium]|nr:hypothetical protein [Kofleriaceae bacterium]